MTFTPPRFAPASALLGAMTALLAPSCRAQGIAPPPTPADAATTWAFSPAADTFAPDALLDLRALNEKTAGESGFVRRSADGNSFVSGKGTPLRFWAVDEYVQNVGDDAMLAHKARWLAKRGVNMVRVHTQIAPVGENDPITAVNTQEVDRVWRLVAAMKKEGIYTTISPYWGIHVKAGKTWNLRGVAPGEELAGRIFFDPALQAGYRSWLQALYAAPNPHTGVPLAKDPAVAIIQIQNEDSLLFWTAQNIKGDALTMLSEQFGAFLTKKYGSLEKANAAWGGETPGADDFQDKQGDAFSKGRAGIYIVWLWTQKPSDQTGYRQKRLSDQLAFFTETMRAFNAGVGLYLKDTLGCPQLVNAGNWRPADPTLLFDAERYSYGANDVMGVNRYFTGAHDGPQNGWAINVGDTFTNNSVLLDPRGMPTNIKQPAGYPVILPETEWVAPTLYQSEGALLTAVYQSLTGVDVSYFFADGDVAEWQPAILGNNLPGKWNIATPMQMGQFPAAALLFRRGYLKQGAAVVHEERTVDDIYARRSPLIAEEAGYDPNRDTGDLPPRSPVKTGADPLAFLVGPVEVVYGGDSAKNRISPDLAHCINAATKTVTGITGEERLNYGANIAIFNAPKAQGAVGFLRRAPGGIALADVTIRSVDEYASVAVVSMDDAPLKTSHKLLVQIGTTARPTGWRDRIVDAAADPRGAKRQVVAVGTNPWAVRRSSVMLSVRNAGLTRAVVLDANGMMVRTVALGAPKFGIVTVAVPGDALYLVLE